MATKGAILAFLTKTKTEQLSPYLGELGLVPRQRQAPERRYASGFRRPFSAADCCWDSWHMSILSLRR